MRTALTIAGSDSSGGAGIQADIKTMMAHHVFGMSAITALTAQNTTGVIDIMEVTPKFLEEELQCIFTDIYPDAVKIGMVSSAELMEVIARNLKKYNAKKIVVDPVMVATSGAKLMEDTAIATLKRTLLPMADLLTPNIPEAEVLAEMEIFTEEDMIAAAQKISEAYGCAVLCKGGHQKNDANDLLYQNGTFRWFRGRRIENPNTHGTGCRKCEELHFQGIGGNVGSWKRKWSDGSCFSGRRSVLREMFRRTDVLSGKIFRHDCQVCSNKRKRGITS